MNGIRSVGSEITFWNKERKKEEEEEEENASATERFLSWRFFVS